MPDTTPRTAADIATATLPFGPTGDGPYDDDVAGAPVVHDPRDAARAVRPTGIAFAVWVPDGSDESDCVVFAFDNGRPLYAEYTSWRGSQYVSGMYDGRTVYGSRTSSATGRPLPYTETTDDDAAAIIAREAYREAFGTDGDDPHRGNRSPLDDMRDALANESDVCAWCGEDTNAEQGPVLHTNAGWMHADCAVTERTRRP